MPYLLHTLASFPAYILGNGAKIFKYRRHLGLNVLNMLHLFRNNTTKCMISETIRQKRREKDISQEDFARLAGISRSRYINFEKGRGKFSEAELVRMAIKLGMTITAKVEV